MTKSRSSTRSGAAFTWSATSRISSVNCSTVSDSSMFGGRVGSISDPAAPASRCNSRNPHLFPNRAPATPLPSDGRAVNPHAQGGAPGATAVEQYGFSRPGQGCIVLCVLGKKLRAVHPRCLPRPADHGATSGPGRAAAGTVAALPTGRNAAPAGSRAAAGRPTREARARQAHRPDPGRHRRPPPPAPRRAAAPPAAPTPPPRRPAAAPPAAPPPSRPTPPIVARGGRRRRSAPSRPCRRRREPPPSPRRRWWSPTGQRSRPGCTLGGAWCCPRRWARSASTG